MATPAPPLGNLLNSRVPAAPSQIHRPWLPLLLLSVLFSAAASASASASAKLSYADHCGSPAPETAGFAPYNRVSFLIPGGYFRGGDVLLGRDDGDSLAIPRSMGFRPSSVYRTRTRGLLGVKGNLILRGGSILFVRRNFTRGRGLFRVFHPRGPGMLNQRGRVAFDMAGFWSESTEMLCMVGRGFASSKEGKALDLSAVFKVKYPNVSNVANSLVAGTLESLDSPGNTNYFDPISFLIYAQKSYEYTLIPQARKMSADVVVPGERPLGLGADDDLCTMFRKFGSGLRVVYGEDCHDRNCSPFSGASGLLPRSLSLGRVQCSAEGQVRMYMAFSDEESFSYHAVMRPERLLVGEGFWDHERNHLSLVACQLLNFTDSLGGAYAGNCTTGLRLWFPEVLSIESRSPLVGRLWTNRSSTDPGYFEMITVQDSYDSLYPISGQKYEYTKIDVARKSCGSDTVGNSRGKKYPDGRSTADLRFDMSLKDSAGVVVWRYANPVSIGDALYGNILTLDTGGFPSDILVDTRNQNVLNISYRISTGSYNGSSDMNKLKDISAEGIYNQDTGTLCLVGCRDMVLSHGAKQKKKAELMDCEILIKIQLPPLDPGAGDRLNGTIKSTRQEADPLYFKPIEISANVMQWKEAAESIWRMDVEITMVLISLTLSCVFIGLQLFYVKKNPDVLPSTSITMLVVLTLGHMIPLVLNFEALFFMDRNRQNVLLWSGGWLEVNEVIVRIITMVAFLLQFRFLQLAWSARSAEGAKRGLWAAERKALQFCLPLYFVGLLIAWLVHVRSYEAPVPRPDSIPEPQISLWEDLISYAGVVLDGFLLPQFLLNVFWNSKVKVLIPAFYGGTTIVRALPHIYDAYRARHYVPHISSSYIYASPEGDLYSSAWNIIIPLGGLLFAVVIYLQQRFGGNCILPPRFRRLGGYEIVSACESCTASA